MQDTSDGSQQLLEQAKATGLQRKNGGENEQCTKGCTALTQIGSGGEGRQNLKIAGGGVGAPQVPPSSQAGRGRKERFPCSSIENTHTSDAASSTLVPLLIT